MGFDPQTAGLPLVNVRKRTTKVNVVIVISVLLFLVIGLYYGIGIARKTQDGETARELAAPAK